MRHPMMLNRRRTALALIDMQTGFRPVMADFTLVAERIALLTAACQLLEIPIIVTEQYPQGLGPTAEEITSQLPAGLTPIDKLTYSACGVADFDLQLRENHTEQVMLCGIEAHICVSQTAHDLLQDGYQVHLLTDAITSRLPHNREVAIERLLRAGAIISSIEMALFELCPAGTAEFKQMQQLIKRLK
jgi:nicotinamidase-related amidase